VYLCRGVVLFCGMSFEMKCCHVLQDGRIEKRRKERRGEEEEREGNREREREREQINYE
jgi:hypothetical protein